jgi:uncharacterized membrane protein
MNYIKILSIIIVTLGVLRFGFAMAFIPMSEQATLHMILGLLFVFLGLWLNKAYRKGASK